MLTKSKIKLIHSLKYKKYRILTKLFVVEGEKIIKEFLESDFTVKALIATPSFIEKLSQVMLHKADEIITADEKEFAKVSFLSTPSMGLALIEMKEKRIDENEIKNNLSLLLENIQDPGNLGTIIRIADWYGIPTVFCSPDTVDIYNPKVVQATMGSLIRVEVHYCNLNTLLHEYPDHDNFQVYGTFLNGSDIYKQPLIQKGFIVLGNESKGISNMLAENISRRLFIPGYPPGKENAESLNASVATAIVCAEFRRRDRGK